MSQTNLSDLAVLDSELGNGVGSGFDSSLDSLSAMNNEFMSLPERQAARRMRMQAALEKKLLEVECARAEDAALAKWERQKQKRSEVWAEDPKSNRAFVWMVGMDYSRMVAFVLILFIFMSRNAQAQTTTLTPALPVAPVTPFMSDDLKDRTRKALDKAASKQPGGALPDFGGKPGVETNRGSNVDAALLTKSPLDPQALSQKLSGAAKPKPGVLVFVSTSMPSASVMRLAQDVRKIGGALVIRGLLGGSMRNTITALQDYSRKGVQILIHPDAFKRHNIKTVPSFVVDTAPDEPMCNDGKVCRTVSQVVEGDVTLVYALERIDALASPALKGQTSQWLRMLAPIGGSTTGSPGLGR